MAGRKTKLTPEVQAKIVQALGVGAPYEQACQFAGINPDTLYTWLKKGEEGKSPFSEFSEAVKNAEGQASVGWLALIDSAARAGQWQAAAWKLERKFPKVWGRQTVEHTVQHGGPVEFVLKVIYANERGDSPNPSPGRGTHTPQIPAPAAIPFLIQPGEA
jgi:transposase